MPVFVAAVVIADVATGGGVRKTAKKAADTVIDAGGKVVDKVVDVARAVAKDPLPVVATVALTAVGVPAPIASAAVTAAKGGSVSQIATAAVASYAGGQVGSKVGSYTEGTQAASQIATATKTSIEAVAKVAASASGSSVAATTAAVIQGKDLGTALKEGAIAGVGGGVGEGVAQGVAANVPIQNRLGQAGVAGAAGGAAQAAVTGEDIAKGAIVSGISSAGATFLGDKRAEAEAARNQVVEAFQQPRTAGVGTQLGQPTAQLSGSIVPASQQDIEETRRQGIELPETRQMRPALPEVTVTAAREPITYIAPTGLARFTPTRPSGGAAPSGVSERDRQVMDMTGLTRAPKPTEDIGAPAADIGTTGAIGRPSVDIGTSTVDGRTGGTVDTGMGTGSAGAGGMGTGGAGTGGTGMGGTGAGGEGEGGTAPKLTEADRRLINFMYGNIGAPMGMPFMGREMGAGSSALAQALSVGDPGALYLGKKGKERRPVWNVESLKLSDELGGTYG